MLTIQPSNEFAVTLASKRRGGMEIHRHYGACMHTLISRWASQVTPHQLTILMFVLDRTFYHNKLSETIVFDQFLRGMSRTDRDEMVFSGLNMSKNTLVLQLKTLIENDFLHAYACVGRDGKTETHARLFAINCNKLFNLDIADEENPMILREPKKKRVVDATDFDADSAPKTARNVLKTPRNSVSKPPKYSPPDLGAIYSIHTDTKVSIVGGASLAEPRLKVDVNSALDNLRSTRLAARAERTANRPTRRSSASATAPTSKVNMQALIDAAMSRYHPRLPRVLVTDKPLGVLKKRLLTAEVDLDAFINWAIQFWLTTASSHERGARRRVADGTTKFAYTPIPSAPDFSTLCYRFPYFLAAFRTYLHADAAGMATTREQQLEQKIEKLERVVENTRDAVRSANERARNATRRRAPPIRQVQVEDEEPATVRTRRAPAARRAVLDDDDLPPAWGDHEPVEKVR